MTIPVPPAWRPSNARTVWLDGGLPLPRGALQSDVPPLAWGAKDPADVLDYTIDASALLAGDDTDAIANASVAFAPDDGTLILGNVAALGPAVVLWMSGGTSGTVYAVQATLSTQNGRTFGRTVLLPVQGLAHEPPPAALLTTEQGQIVTDGNGNPVLVAG